MKPVKTEVGRKTLLVGVLIISLASGFFAGNFSQTESCLGIIDGAATDKLAEAEPYDRKFGAGWITEKKEGPLYSFNVPNASGKADKWGMKPFYLELNSKGMRDEGFNVDKPENTTRVLIMGTSTTLGYGIKRENIYSEIVEKRLNKDFQKNVQILNAGSPGYGMKDYYKYLKYRGLDYNPDIVVIAFNRVDWYSRNQTDQFHRKSRQMVREREDFKYLTSDEINSLKRKRMYNLIYESYDEDNLEETGLGYLPKIQGLADSRNITPLYYSIDSLDFPGQKQFVESWAKENDKTIYYSPRKYRNSGSKYHNSEWDAHPDAEGHRLIAEGLIKPLRDKVEMENESSRN
jgi:lysophospholipase L1-like esterase